MTALWTHQQRTLDQIAAAKREGYRRILVTAPTGAGKTRIMEELLETERSAILYTDRIMLWEQLAERLGEAGFDFGLRASGYECIPHFPIQLAMVQSEVNHVTKYKRREHHRCDTVILDEAHRMKAEQMQTMLDLHMEDGATLIGFTATPIGCGDLYDHLVVAADNSECRACGSHIPAYTYAPDEPDLKDIKRQATGEFENEKMAKLFKRPVVFGRVYDHWCKLNPDAKPTILFGPDVAGSQWFCEQFHEKGVRAAHIDANQVIIDGEIYEPTRETREQLIRECASGEIQVLCNRFVLREGIDIPQLYHGIFACAVGTLTGYLQAGGRLLRNHPSLDHVVVQDHGGNWHRHGSLNANREWALDCTEATLRKSRAQSLREKQEPEGLVCPECQMVRTRGNTCPHCGHVISKRSRVVIQRSGQLKEVTGDIYKPRREARADDDNLIQTWKECVFRCGNAKQPKSFNQAMGLFCRENGGRYPHGSWPLVPADDVDGMQKITKDSLSEIGREHHDRKRTRHPEPGKTLFGKGAA